MKNIGLRVSALCIVLVLIGYSGLSEAGQALQKSRLIFRLSVDQLRDCLNPDNPGYLDVAGHPDKPGYPGTRGYRGPNSPRIKEEFDLSPYEGFYEDQAKDMLTALAKAKLTEQDYRAAIDWVDKHTSKDKYEVSLVGLVGLRGVITGYWFSDTGVEERDKVAYGMLNLVKKVNDASEAQMHDIKLEASYDMLGQMIRLLAHNCETQSFRK